jgi:amidase
MAQAAAADDALAKDKWLGSLHGLPVGVKDLHETSGIRTTFGSPLHRDYLPDFDCRVVPKEKNAGAIVIGKTNVPEFGLGSQTFNPVFGPRRSPYDTTKTSGGSTGGGAVALACGKVPLADGSDMGGSLRNPQFLQCSRPASVTRTRLQRAYEPRLVHTVRSGPGGSERN